MGLLNVNHTNMTQSVIDLQADLLKNPFYLFNDKKGIPVDYYNINTSKTTLDPALNIQYANRGEDSPYRFNLIKGLYIYGLDRMVTNYENGEFGVSASDITGEAIILPDTITPYPGDNFVIPMIRAQRYLFTVTSVTMDTFNNGGNYWKIEYVIDRLKDEEIQNQIVDEFQFVSGNVGTNYTPVLAKTKYDMCKILDDAAVNMKQLFKGLYFNEKVQTYTFTHMYEVSRSNMETNYFYDPYMIEFIIKNKVLANSGDKYDFVDHKTSLRPEFGIKYNRSIWKVLELNEKEELPGCKYISNAAYIDDPSTIFSTRYENYFELTYNPQNSLAEVFADSVNIIDPQVIGHILEDQLFDYQDPTYGKYNLLVKYFNNHDNIGTEDIIPFERIVENDNNVSNYFLLPMIIYIMEYYIKDMMLMRESEK